MLDFQKSTIDDMKTFQEWSKAPAVHRWILLADWEAYYQIVSKQDHYFLYSVYRETELIGFVAAEMDNEKAALLLLVSPGYHGQGTGTAILRQLIAQYKSLFGDVSALSAGIFKENAASIRCFEKAGFAKTDVGNDGEIIYSYALGG